MLKTSDVVFRLRNSAVVWSWAMNGLRLTSGVVILPLLIHKLAKPDYDMYFVLLSITALIPILDMGFAVNIGRAVSYATGGAGQLQIQGLPLPTASGGPNFPMLWRLLHTTRRLYAGLALAVLLLVGLGGTFFIKNAVPQTTTPWLTWAAWGVTLVAITWEIYSGRWSVFLRNMNRVLPSAQLAVLAQAVKIVLSCVLLMSGAGLLSVPLAGIFASFLQRALAQRLVLRLLDRKADQGITQDEVKATLRTLWPNTWRIGIHFLSSYLAGQANTLICLPLLGLAASGQYGFSLQMIALCLGMAQVWTFVKWPQVEQLRVKQDLVGLRRLLWFRLWAQNLTYIGLVIAVIIIVPFLLRWLNSDKTMLPAIWLCFMALNGLFDLHCNFWNTLIATENRLPMVWPMLIGNVCSFLTIVILSQTTDLGLASFVIVPLIVGSMFNYWKWPRYGARTLGTSWVRFLFTRPQ